jgi:hypothetical protein
LTNPSKRNEKAKFLIHVGNGFIVDSYCARLDALEPPMFGINTPNDWLIELCSDLIQTKNPNDSAHYKSFVVEIEIKNLTRAHKYDGSVATLALKAKREKEWMSQNKDTRINPSQRK